MNGDANGRSTTNKTFAGLAIFEMVKRLRERSPPLAKRKTQRENLGMGAGQGPVLRRNPCGLIAGGGCARTEYGVSGFASQNDGFSANQSTSHYVLGSVDKPVRKFN